MEKAGAKAEANGQISFTLRVGVTGHRAFDDPESLLPAVLTALGQVKELASGLPDDQLILVVISALAEGADRLVAELVLAEPGSRLEAALPLPAEDYERDFADAASRRQFRQLLKRSTRTWIAPATKSREEAYEQAGRYMVDRSDVIVALWDGKPARGQGGTAAIVAYARDRDVPLVLVQTQEKPPVTSKPTGPRTDVVRKAAHRLKQYNLGAIGAADFDARVRKQIEDLRPDLPEASRIDPLCLSVENTAAWLVPYFVRADVLAVRLQRRFWGLSTATFVMAAAAVLIVAIQVNFFSSLNWLVALEVIALVGLLTVPILNWRLRLHDRWISYRFLAERLRSAYFLTLAGALDGRPPAVPLAYLSDPSEAWIERALAEVVTHRPETGAGSPDLSLLRRYLSQYWISGQIGYHQKAARRHRWWDDALTRATVLLFSLTLVAAVLHTAGIGERGAHRTHLALLLIVASIAIPAIGAAIHGISTQREFRRHADRYQRMAGLLTRLRDEMDSAESAKRVRQLAADTEGVMREENSDWFGVMRFHDMELIT